MVKINVLGWFLYGDENVWDNLSGARFESDFYKAAYNCIERIVTGKDLQGRNMMPSFITEYFGRVAEKEKNWKLDREAR